VNNIGFIFDFDNFVVFLEQDFQEEYKMDLDFLIAVESKHPTKKVKKDKFPNKFRIQNFIPVHLECVAHVHIVAQLSHYKTSHFQEDSF
jgi:hypothetical protein